MGISLVSDRYEARARIYVDTQTVLKPLMTGLTFQPDIDEQVRMLARTLISRPNMERLVRMPELRLAAASEARNDEVVSRLMDQIKVAPTTSGNLYEISYRGSSPQGSQRLVEATVNLFVHAGAGAKKRDSEDAGRFIDDQIREYEAKLVDAENRRKDFKVRTFGVSGVSNQDYFARMSALSDEVNKLQMELTATERTRDSYRRELAAEEPQLPIDTRPALGSGLANELTARRKQLDELLLRYTDRHPDVISTRRMIDQLEVEIRERKEAEQRAWTTAGKVGEATSAPTSPVYQQLRISLANAEAQLASLRSQVAVQQGRLDQIRALAGQMPQVEAELAQLNRDYDIIRKNYEVMVARRESALLGMKLDESSQLAEFRVIDPPRVQRFPVFPGRLHLAAMAIVLSIGAGLAAAVLAERVKPTLDEPAELQLLSGRPVLGTVPVLMTPEESRQRRLGTIAYAMVFTTLIALQGAWVGWLALGSAS